MDLKLLPNNAMTFTENQHGNAVLEKLRLQREMVRCCDVILHVNGKKFHAHRCVLSACSPFFDSLFKASKTVKEQLTISADSTDVFQILLAYMYTGTVIVDKMNVSELLKLANKLLLNKLKEYCAEYLQRYLDTRNCLTVLEMANKYRLESLQKIANSHIAVHIMEIIGGKEILDLPLIKLENFIQNSNWNLSNEEMLSLITSWVYHIPEERETNFRSLLTWIAWQEINAEHVVKIIQEHPLFSCSPKCRAFIHDVLFENNLINHSVYPSLTDFKLRGNENGNIDEDNERFITIAISSAISESFLSEMDSGKDLPRVELPPADQQTVYDSRDINQLKIVGSTSELDQHSYIPGNYGNLQNKMHIPRNSILPSNPNYAQNLDIEELCKYTIENTQKLNKPHAGEGSEEDHNHPVFNHTDYGNIMYNEPNCYHYRDYRDGEHFNVQNGDKCPKMTNKVAYMNHKYDANYSNHISLSELNYQKNLPMSSEFNPSTFQLDLSKDNALNLGGNTYSDEPISFSQDTRCQTPCPLSPNTCKKDCIINENGFTEIPNNTFHNNILENSDNINLVMSSSHQDLFYMGCSDDTQGSNNYPQDMSLPHLKFGDCNSALGIDDKGNKIYTTVETHEHNSNYVISEPRDQNDICLTTKSNEINSMIDSEVISHPPECPVTNSVNEELDEIRKSQSDPEMNNNISDIIPSDQGQIPKNSEGKSQRRRNAIKALSNEDKIVKKKTSQKKKKIEKKSEQKDATKGNERNDDNKKVCEVCGKVFDRKKDYFIHMVEHFSGPPFRCEFCKSNFKRIYYLIDHRKTHTDEKPFKCPTCPFSSRKKCNLKEHMLYHSSERPFKCEDCGETFIRKQHLTVHRTKHTDQRPLVCDTCGWTAKTRNSLLFHTKIHTGDLYSCQYPECTYKTPKRSHLKEHMNFHTKSRPFECKLCGMRYISNSHYQRHLLKHEKPRSLQCTHCDYCTSRADMLKDHVKRKHTDWKPKSKPQRKRANGNAKKARKSGESTNNEESEAKSVPAFVTKQHHPTKMTPPSLSASLPSYSHQTSVSPTSCSFGTPGDPDDPLTIVSEMEDDNQSLASFHQSSYLDPHIGQEFSGLLEQSCEPGRFTLNSNEDLYYNEQL